ncbi:MAG: hypothetical protein HY862_18550 [Chloroflexi bacterium]|nr:hypothetical protein [Chloroflexota bacterium]
MNRLLIVGAGASLEECKQSGNYPNDPERYLPSIKNFCGKLFQRDSEILLQVTSSYLDKLGMKYDSKLINLKPGDSFSSDDMEKSPIGIFLKLESQSPEEHNIERLCEYVWVTFGASIQLWEAFIYAGIYLHLFTLFTRQFGLGIGVPMLAGRRVANQLTSSDVVLNLNYDIAFDLALKQSGKNICYAPDLRENAISILKPHGSFNFYVNLVNGNCYFEEPDRIHGSVSIPDPSGGFFSPHGGIVPPRLNKSYIHHPGAEIILDTCRPFLPKIVTFWGVGLTDSDVDLLSIYREAATSAEIIEFINPAMEAHQKAEKLLNREIAFFATLDQWLEKYGL